MLLIVYNVKFVTLVYPLPRSPPSSLFVFLSVRRQSSIFFVVPLFVNQALHRGGWKQLQIHTERRPGAQVVPSNNGSVYSPHTKITCANKNQFGSQRTTSWGSQLACQKKKKKEKKKKQNIEELWLRYPLNVVTVTSYIAELLYTL